MKEHFGSPCSIIIGENINPTENGNPYVCGEGLICDHRNLPGRGSQYRYRCHV